MVPYTDVNKIIDASTIFERLGLPAKKTSIKELSKQFKLLAVKVHPDKCAHPDSKKAFQLLAEGYQQLCDPTVQTRELEAIHRNEKCRELRPNKEFWCHTWTIPWAVFEKCFEARERLENELRQDFLRSQSAKYLARRLRNTILQAEKTVVNLDELHCVECHWLWPVTMQNTANNASSDERDNGEQSILRSAVSDDTPSLEDDQNRLVNILFYLRHRYNYCLYCGCAYTDAQDKEKCPGPLEQDH